MFSFLLILTDSLGETRSASGAQQPSPWAAEQGRPGSAFLYVRLRPQTLETVSGGCSCGSTVPSPAWLLASLGTGAGLSWESGDGIEPQLCCRLPVLPPPSLSGNNSCPARPALGDLKTWERPRS